MEIVMIVCKHTFTRLWAVCVLQSWRKIRIITGLHIEISPKLVDVTTGNRNDLIGQA